MAALVVVVVGVVWGWRVQRDPNTKLGAAPLVGRWQWRAGIGTLWPVLVAVGTVAWLPGLVRRASFRVVLWATAAATALFTFALAASDGLHAVLAPVVHPSEYWANLATLPSVHETLRHYGTIDFLLGFSVHAKGHPPGFLVLLQGLAAIGLGHPWVAGSLSFLGAAAVPVAVLVTARTLSSETAARTVAPFLVLAPYAVWMGTSADAFYAGVTACGAAACVVAAHTDRRARRRALASVGGLLLGAALFLSYGVVVFLLLPAVLIATVARSRTRAVIETAVVAAGGAAAVTTAFALAGFWWFDGLRTTKKFYWWGTAQFRPWKYFLVGNVAAALIALGPVVVTGIARLRFRPMWFVVGAAAACIALADLSQYSKAEVERIWLIFFPWLVPGVVSLGPSKRWLALHASAAVVLQTWLVSKW